MINMVVMGSAQRLMILVRSTIEVALMTCGRSSHRRCPMKGVLFIEHPWATTSYVGITI